MLLGTIIYVSTLILAPFLAYISLKYLRLTRQQLMIIFGIMLFHLLLHTIFKISPRGDLADYIVYGLEYSLSIYLVFRLISELTVKLSRIFKTILTWILGIVSGLALIITPIQMVLMQEAFPEQIHHLDGNFEVREYRYGFATLESTTFTFELYRNLWFLEQKMTEARMEDTKTELELYRGTLSFDVNLDMNEFEIGSENGVTEQYPIKKFR